MAELDREEKITIMPTFLSNLMNLLKKKKKKKIIKAKYEGNGSQQRIQFVESLLFVSS